MSHTETSKTNECHCVHTDCDETRAGSTELMSWVTLPWVIATPFGTPVVPEVYITYARSWGAGTGREVAGQPSIRASSTSMTTRSVPSSRSANPAVVTAATGAASEIMNCTRASGIAGSIGR